MLPGLDLVVAAGFLQAAAGGIACTVPKAPTITVAPVTRPIEYDFSKTTAELGAMKSDTVNPYGPGADTTTGGLREDKANTKIEVAMGYQQYNTGATCLWYDAVKVTIELAPKVYVAKDYGGKGACHDAIRTHEERHVQVDREVINQYVQGIGGAVRAAVNRAGATGPFDRAHLSAMQKKMSAVVEQSVLAQKTLMQQDMRRRQAQVDTLAEYERVAKICHGRR